MKLVFFGTPEFALPSLQQLFDSRHEVTLVVSKPDRPKGRRQEMTTPPVIGLARHRDLRVDQTKNVKGQQFADTLAATGADVAVVVAYGKILPEHLLHIPPHGFVNLHPSLLPRHRGPSPIQWTLVCGDQVTGVTTMLLDEGMDTGPILLQRRVAIEPRDTVETLAPRLAVEGADLLVETLDGIEEGTVHPRPQPADGANVTPMLRRSFAKIEWEMPARHLVNRLRGFTPWPGLYASFRDGRLKIHGLEEVTPPPRGDEPPGTVLAVSADGIVVRCGRSTAVRITEVQREGRRRLPVDAFLIGERVSRGERFE